MPLPPNGPGRRQAWHCKQHKILYACETYCRGLNNCQYQGSIFVLQLEYQKPQIDLKTLLVTIEASISIVVESRSVGGSNSGSHVLRGGQIQSQWSSLCLEA